jgi:hypothetical protein
MYATIDVDFSIADALAPLHALSMHGLRCESLC